MADETPSEEYVHEEDKEISANLNQRYVDGLPQDRAEAEWNDLAIELRQGTLSELRGELNPIQLTALESEREHAKGFFRRFGGNNVQAVTMGLISCIPDEAWDIMRSGKLSDPETRELVEFFDLKRQAKDKPAT
ncbi:MAG: hypothetical protein ACREGC_04490, partial [Minisyncoccia bacterium]